MFKSYYVVWKQISKHPNFNDERSLNRTMQYGNKRLGKIIGWLVVAFKSYYVVWKQADVENEVFNSNSLNRTMQYGNV